MGLNWFGADKWFDDREPEDVIPVVCERCGEKLNWSKPVSYRGAPPKHGCGGEVKFAQNDDEK